MKLVYFNAKGIALTATMMKMLACFVLQVSGQLEKNCTDTIYIIHFLDLISKYLECSLATITQWYCNYAIKLLLLLHYTSLIPYTLFL